MKINFVSDLHLEFGPQTLPGGDVLILAGDICEARSLSKDYHSTKPEPYTPGAFRYYDFFETECAKYDRVFMVMGNHEHYHGRFDRTYDTLKGLLPANITLLENEIVEHNGVMIMGATMWTDCNKGDDLTLYHLKGCMNDYKVVQNYYKDRNVYHKLIPEHTCGVHRKTREWFKLMLSMHRDKPFVIVTHHAPSFMSVPDMYKGDQLMNGGYASDLSEFILDNENIKIWIHGHMHDPIDYEIGQCRVISNPKGYQGWDPNFGSFDPAKSIDV
jgi:Icc-related predicted phosphoesterase